MDIEVLNRIILSRHLYGLGLDACKSSNDKFLFAAVNLLQDSVEAFLLALAHHVNAAIDQNTKFDKLFDLINAKISSKELSFRNKLISVNRIRINSKHYGIQPNRDEVERLFVSVREFFEETSTNCFGVFFNTVSLIDLLHDGEVKKLLIEAKSQLEDGNFSECAINCRKAIYLEFEKDFDVSRFREGAKTKGLPGFWARMSRAPYYTRDKEYIAKNVKNPTDYIIIDHSVLDQELLKYSIDSTSFWNVWRLTPEVWRDDDRNWYVKRDFDKLDYNHIKDHIEYIYSTTADIIYSITIKKASIKTQNYQEYFVELLDEIILVYEKADIESPVVGSLPQGLSKVDCDFSVEGFGDDGPYWHISYCDADNKKYINGYIHNRCLLRNKG